MNARLPYSPSAILLAVALSCDSPAAPQAGGAASTLRDFNGAFAYLAVDQAGRPLLSGTLELSVQQDSSVTGTWSIEWIPGADTSAVVGPQVGSGTLAGRLERDTVRVDMNPGWADNNVFLVGRAEASGRITGDWHHSTIAGGVAGGRFRATRRP